VLSGRLPLSPAKRFNFDSAILAEKDLLSTVFCMFLIVESANTDRLPIVLCVDWLLDGK
jgi:hypothetical protein